MASIGGSKGKSKSSSEVTLPDWLKPFVTQSTSTAQGALGDLSRLMRGDTVADLNFDQLAGLDAMRGLAGGDFFGTAQDVFMDAARGVGTGFLDPALRDQLMGSDFDLGSFVNQARDATAFTENQVAQDQLERTASGDYLFGGKGFDAALNAAINSALPQVASAFGGTVGGVGSGLASTAVNQAALDAFAGQYGQERGRQLGAAEALASGGRADRAGFLDFSNAAMNRGQRGRELLAGLSDTERGRQMAAAAGLPDIGMLDANAMMQVGEYLQGQEQREMTAPLENMLRLFMASSGAPSQFAPFLGQNTRGKTSQFGWGLSTEGLGMGKDAPWWLS